MREIASDPEQLGEFLGGLAGDLTLDVHVGRMSVARNADDAPRSPSNRSVCSPNSFRADTPVLTPDGEKPISEIKIGDQVLAYNEATGEVGVYPVTAVLVNYDPAIVELTIDQERLETTPEHPFYVEDTGWVNAGELKPGNQVRQADGTTGTVQRVEVVQREQVMYNLTVAGAHTFFVGEEGWLVHNTDCKIIEKIGREAFGEVIFRGNVQNAPMRDLTHHQILHAFENTPYTVSNHAIMRLKDIRTANIGIKSLNDVARVLNKGIVETASRGLVSLTDGHFEAIINPITKVIVTFSPK